MLNIPTRAKALAIAAALAAVATTSAVASAGGEQAGSADPTHDGASHEQMSTSVPALKGMKVRLVVRQGPGGVLVHVRTKRFKFAPARMAPDHERPWPPTPGEGHIHLYVDGKKRPATLLVGPWTYVGLRAGRHRLRVTLNANTHAEYQRRGKPVQDATTFSVKG
ncbi:MAG: hypothetical protein ACRDN8_00145 [Thermoleophilaceae bacterium]